MSSRTPRVQHLLATILLTLSTASALVAQTVPKVAWQRSYGGSGEDTLTSVAEAPDGGFILGGYSTSPVSGNRTNAGFGDYDYWVLKVDPNGAKQWERTFGGEYEDKLLVVRVTQDGGYILGGYSESEVSGNKTSTNFGFRDFWIVKLDASGDRQWDKSFGGVNSDILYGLCQTSDGGFVLAGTSDSLPSGNKTSPKIGGPDFWVIKINSVGEKEWENTFGGTGADRLYVLQTNTQGGYVLGGYSPPGASGSKTNAGFGSGWYDCWLVTLDSGGNKLGDLAFGGDDFDYLYAFSPTTDGDYLLGGTSRSAVSGNKTATGFGGFDFWLVKSDASGNAQWDKAFGGGSDEELHCVIQTANGGYVAAGNSWSAASGNKQFDGFGNDDYWILGLDSNGEKQWELNVGGSGRDELQAIIKTQDGGLLLAGNSNSGESGNKTTEAFGNYDFWILKLAQVNDLRFTSFGFSTNGAFFAQLKGASSGTYIFQTSPDLTNWVSISTNAAVDGAASFVDTNAVDLSRRFYRVQEQ
jgi:hypothetical protein